MVEVRLTGDLARLKAFGEALEAAGRRGQIGEAVWRVVVDDVGPLRESARVHARAILPSGLGEVVAQTPMPITARVRGRWRGIRIDARPGRGKGGVNDPAAVDRGRVRHPVFGRWYNRAGRDISVIQIVPAGWFRTPMAKGAERTRAQVRAALQKAIEELRP